MKKILLLALLLCGLAGCAMNAGVTTPQKPAEYQRVYDPRYGECYGPVIQAQH